VQPVAPTDCKYVYTTQPVDATDLCNGLVVMYEYSLTVISAPSCLLFYFVLLMLGFCMSLTRHSVNNKLLSKLVDRQCFFLLDWWVGPRQITVEWAMRVNIRQPAQYRHSCTKQLYQIHELAYLLLLGNNALIQVKTPEHT